MAAVSHWCERERVGQCLDALLLNEHKLRSFEDATSLIDVKWKTGPVAELFACWRSAPSLLKIATGSQLMSRIGL